MFAIAANDLYERQKAAYLATQKRRREHAARRTQLNDLFQNEYTEQHHETVDPETAGPMDPAFEEVYQGDEHLAAFPENTLIPEGFEERMD